MIPSIGRATSMSGKLIASPRPSSSQFSNPFFVSFPSSGKSSSGNTSRWPLFSPIDEEVEVLHVLYSPGQWVIVMGLRAFERGIYLGIGCNIPVLSH
jgi:hypothetical protein